MNNTQDMTIRNHIKKQGSTITIILSLMLIFMSLLVTTSSSNTDSIAVKTEKRIKQRMDLLDSYMKEALNEEHNEWLTLGNLPEDMVVYRYVCDTLQSWCNQFPVINDDIGSRLILQRLSNLRSSLSFPLSDISEKVSYINLGSKWYIVKAATDSVNCKVIGGMEIMDTFVSDLRKSDKGINPHLGISGRFSILPINYSGGSPVYLDSVPLFKIILETGTGAPLIADSLLRWMSLIFFSLSIVLFLWTHRSVRVYAISIAIFFAITVTAYLWGLQMKGSTTFFSPTIYADGLFFNSFSSLIIVNTFVFLYTLCTYIMRKKFLAIAIKSKRYYAKPLYGLFIASIFILITVYLHYSLCSLIMNSNISMELYVWSNITLYTLWVYLSYSSLLFSLLLLLQIMKPVIKDVTGIRYNAFSKKFLFGFAAVCAMYFTITAGVLGFRKEQNKVTVWTNRLAIDRDLGLELQLRSVEEGIAGDPFISALSNVERGNIMIINRLTENYLSRVSKDYDITVYPCKDSDKITYGQAGVTINCLDFFNHKIQTGIPIANGSRFIYTNDRSGRPGYIGMFIYYSPENGIVRLFIEIESKSNREEQGYYSILGQYSQLGEVNIPPFYSYAKFIAGKLVMYKGTYAYPTVMDQLLKESIDEAGGHTNIKSNRYIHFINQVSDDEVIIISRPIRNVMTFTITFSYLILIAYSGLLLFSRANRKKKKVFRNDYFRSRINTVLFAALFLSLVCITTVSITFVYNRNERNLKNMMSDKISTVQAMLESRCRHASSYRDLATQEFTASMENIGATTKSDISLYTPGGKVFKSTTPEVFDKMVIGSRINQKAYYNIKYQNQRFYISSEQMAGNNYYSLYAPLFNAGGKMIAIISVPYTDSNYDFNKDALFHAAAIINIFFILLAVSIIISTIIINAMFRPLIEMGEKMKSADIHGLEYIIYKRNDEISTLVDAYNRMVHDLSDSTRQLAQAERDKAWSEMARQVAHEIKNPLTPIKLEIQRLIRLKQKNDPSWSEKFDKVASIVLEHIDILTDTANEFSTFAKLYSEEPVLLDLDKTLRDQLAIFDNKDNITIDYIGMENAMVMAPKPQLIRVFVNLITNAIQAIEIQQKESMDKGEQPAQGRVLLYVRNSVKDGYYDIGFEDNGPGVSNENLGKLFTPNFTTKSGGTGLGLAICRNIIEKCQGEISYQKSFAFKGACFTVRLPRKL